LRILSHHLCYARTVGSKLSEMEFLDINNFTEKDLELFPSYDEYCDDLKMLSEMDLSNKNSEEIYNIIYDYLKILPACFGVFSPTKFNKIPFYRCRIKNNIGKIENKDLIQTHSFPPSNVCKENGRANLKNHSVFYCSNDPRAAILESKPKTGDEVYLSEWKAKATRNIKFNLCLPTKLPENNIWNMVANDKNSYIKTKIKGFTNDKFRHYAKLLNFISESFISERKPYSLTSMISHIFLFNELINDFIVYPSVVSNSNYCNLAFHPNSVLENLKFDKVYKLKINALTDDQIEFNFGVVGTLKNSRMIWRRIKQEEREKLLK